MNKIIYISPKYHQQAKINATKQSKSIKKYIHELIESDTPLEMKYAND